MDNSTAILMIKALDCLSMRATVTAENIANAGSPNYRPLRVTFEDALKTAAAEGDGSVQRLSPVVERFPTDSADGALRPDLEMATAVGTAGRYGALLEMLNRQLQLQVLAATGNN